MKIADKESVINTLSEENNCLRQGLRFYANKEHLPSTELGNRDTLIEDGEVARRALLGEVFSVNDSIENYFNEKINREGKLASATEKDPNGKNSHEPGAKLDAGKVQMALVVDGFKTALQYIYSLQSIVNSRAITGTELNNTNGAEDLLLHIAPKAMFELCCIASHGAEKYTPNGWKHVPDAISRYRSADLRHAYAVSTGERYDKQSKLLHASHQLWNKVAVLELLLSDDKCKQAIDRLFSAWALLLDLEEILCGGVSLTSEKTETQSAVEKNHHYPGLR